MTEFYIVVDGGFVVGIGTNGNDSAAAITETEYSTILQKIRSAPTAPDGYQNKLRADTLEWEPVELPPAAEDEEATAADYEAALKELGVNFDEEE